MNNKKINKMLAFNYEKVVDTFIEKYGKDHGLISDKTQKINTKIDKVYIPSVELEVPEVLIKNNDKTISIILSLESKGLYKISVLNKDSFNFELIDDDKVFKVLINDHKNKIDIEIENSEINRVIMTYLSTLFTALILYKDQNLVNQT